MAKKIEQCEIEQQRRARKSRSGRDAARDDLAVLAPDITLTIDDRKVTVREYRFLESLRLQPLMQPLVECLAQSTAPGVTVGVDQVNAALGEYPEIVTHLMAVSCDQDPAWVGNLPRRAGAALFSAWWQVNKDFFLQSVVQRVVITLARRASAGSASSPPSSPTDTAAPISTPTSTRAVN